MEEISIRDSEVLESCMGAFRKFPVVMIQFPEVFGLMALPNQDGINGLNRVKNRLPGKLYGTIIGDLHRFISMGTTSGFPEYASTEDEYQKLEGAILRIKVGDESKNTSTISNGTHQSLLLPGGLIRSFFQQLEKEFFPLADSGLFLGHPFSAPLCTSANMSGHPDGSITNIEIAREFGKKNGVPLLIRSEEGLTSSKGSYPILSLEKSKIWIERKGPGLDKIISRFEPGLISFRTA